MRSATSYCNGALYRKTLARFWPLWGLWGVGWLFLLPLHLLNTHLWQGNTDPTWLKLAARDLPDFLQPGLFVAVIFAVLCAMAVFGYLYNHRSACWFHALPLRREALFTTQYLAGLSMLLLPLLAAAVLTAMVELAFLPMGDWSMAMTALLTWLLAQSGMCLFFFSFAAFCAMFTGHILALPAFYFILNFLASGVWYLLNALMNEFYYGYVSTPGAEDVVEALTPAWALRDAVRWGYNDGTSLLAPGKVLVYALVGVGLALASLYVYRRRHVETAGDVVAVAIVRPVFKYGVSFCSGLAFGMFTATFFNLYDAASLIPCILIWAVIGYFAAEMLLKKSFRVFKAWKGAAGVVAVLLVICVVCWLDLFGVVGRVPKVDQVASVEVHVELGYPYDDGRYLDITVKDPEQLARITALHRAVVDHRSDADDSRRDVSADGAYISFYYELKGGGELNRRYYDVPYHAEDLETEGTVAYVLRQFAQDRELVKLAYGFDTFLEGSRLTTARLRTVGQFDGSTSVYVDDYAQALWDAVLADFDEGTIGTRWPFFNQEMMDNTCQTSLIFGATDNKVADRPGVEVTNPANYELEIYLTPHAKHTLAVLDRTGLWEEGYFLYPWEDENYTPETYSEPRAERAG